MYCYYYNLCGGGGVTAQLQNYCPSCSNNLSGFRSGINIAVQEFSYCKPSSNSCTPVNYFDVQYKENTCPQKAPEDWDDDDDLCSDDPALALRFKAYYPSNHDYTLCALPVIILFHAGSYAECSSFNNPGIVGVSQELAKRGFVVFNVNYRVGVTRDIREVPGGVPAGIEYTSAQQWLALYRALQDAVGAICSIIKMSQDNVFSSYFTMDEDNIFLGGISAGSVIAMTAGYYGNQGKFNTIFPGVSASLGNIAKPDVYYSNAFNYHPRIKGILNCWGSLIVPAEYSYYIDPYSFFSGQGFDLPPIISFHGKEDETFNFQYQGVYFPPDEADEYGTNQHEETRCLPTEHPYAAPLPEANGFPHLLLIGSETIYEMLKDNTILTEFYFDCQMAHGLDNDCGTCNFQSDFGTGLTTQAAVYSYICARAATFFQAILGNNTSGISVTKFTECANTKYTCTGSSTGCSNNDNCD